MKADVQPPDPQVDIGGAAARFQSSQGPGRIRLPAVPLPHQARPAEATCDKIAGQFARVLARFGIDESDPGVQAAVRDELRVLMAADGAA